MKLIILLSSVAVLHVVVGLPQNFQQNNQDDLIFIRGQYFRRDGNSMFQSISAEPQLYSQCVDHDDGTCETKWNQRYWWNTQHWRPGGPLFFMFGGEANANGYIDFYAFNQFAAEYGAALAVLEHRFYGESFPTEDTSFYSMTLLTSAQALADAARFILEVKASSPDFKDAKVVVFGGSYPGNLAAWFRQKYPDIANVAVASSAPVQAVFEFPEYMRTVSEVIAEIDQPCFSKIRTSFNCMEELVHSEKCQNTRYNSSNQLPQALHQCYAYDFTNEYHKQVFFYNLGMRWAGNYPARENAPRCGFLNGVTESDVIDGYGNYLLDSGSATPCSNESFVRDEVLDFIKSKQGDDGNSWVWQTCYEFGYYQIADLTYQLFGYDWDTLIDVRRCQDAFGDIFTEEYIKKRIANTNAYYKGKDFDATCTIFINGQRDPWHPLGFNSQSETSVNNTVISIPLAEHCADMLQSTSPYVQQAQTQIKEQIGKYLNDPNCV